MAMCKAEVWNNRVGLKPCGKEATRGRLCGNHQPAAVARRRAKYAAMWAKKQRDWERQRVDPVERDRRSRCFSLMFTALKIALADIKALQPAGPAMPATITMMEAAIREAETQSRAAGLSSD